MAEKPTEEGADGAEDDAEAAPKKKMGIMKLALFIGLPVVILGLGGVAALMLFTGGGDESHEVAELDEHGQPVANGGGHGPAEPEEVYFYEVPQMQVTIQNGSGGFAHLQISFHLEIADEHISEELDHELPRIIDQFQGFLREMRPEDLAGSAGGYRMRLELLRRVNLVLGEDKVRAVLIDQFVVA